MQALELGASWSRSWAALGASGNGSALMATLIAAYQAPQRRYHTLQHLIECLALFEQYRSEAEQPAEVEMALWFHDAVYAVKATDNEAQSARWAAAELTAAGVGPPTVDRVEQLILATRHSALPVGRDQSLLVDIDLAILGAPAPRFAEYEAQVREEYQWVPAELFGPARREILNQLLARNPIYTTPALRQALEGRARDNLSARLRQPQ